MIKDKLHTVEIKIKNISLSDADWLQRMTIFLTESNHGELVYYRSKYEEGEE